MDQSKSKLIKCPVCQREVSSGAMKCPGCGEPISPQQIQIDQAAYVASDAFNRMLSFILWAIAWILGLGLWIGLAMAFPKTISVLTVLCCSGLIIDAKEKGILRSLKWVRLIVFYLLSALFFSASFFVK